MQSFKHEKACVTGLRFSLRPDIRNLLPYFSLYALITTRVALKKKAGSTHRKSVFRSLGASQVTRETVKPLHLQDS